MAVVNLDTTKITLVKDTPSADMAVLAEVAGDATDACYFTADKGTNKYLIYALNSNSGSTVRTFTVKGVDSQFGGQDLASGNIAATKSKLVAISDIGRFLITSGTYKGKIKIEVSHAEVKLAVIALP